MCEIYVHIDLRGLFYSFIRQFHYFSFYDWLSQNQLIICEGCWDYRTGGTAKVQLGCHLCSCPAVHSCFLFPHFLQEEPGLWCSPLLNHVEEISRGLQNVTTGPEMEVRLLCSMFYWRLDQVAEVLAVLKIQLQNQERRTLQERGKQLHGVRDHSTSSNFSCGDL